MTTIKTLFTCRNRVQFLLQSVILLALGTASAQASTLSNGSLTVDIRDDNGAIDAVLFAGRDFYNPGVGMISDYFFQNGTDTGTFLINTTTGGPAFMQEPAPQPVTVSSSDGTVVVTGTYTGGGANVDFTRTYSLVDGLDVLKVSTDFVNNGSEAVELLYGETYEPDQGVSPENPENFTTFEDVSMLPTDAGLATVVTSADEDGLSVVLGSLAPDAIVGASPFLDALPLGLIFNGDHLNSFIDNPFNPESLPGDLGINIAISRLIPAGGTSTFESHQAYGTSIEEAQAQFVAAKSTPESRSVLGLLAMGTFVAGSALKRQLKGIRVVSDR